MKKTLALILALLMLLALAGCAVNGTTAADDATAGMAPAEAAEAALDTTQDKMSISDIVRVPFGYLLDWLDRFANNYGVALILFSLIVKLVLLPMSIKGKKSMLKMSRLAPMAKALEEKYGVGVVAMNVLTDGETEYSAALEKVLREFDLRDIDVDFPEWLKALPADNAVVKTIIDTLRSATKNAVKMKDEPTLIAALSEIDRVAPEQTDSDAGSGTLKIKLALDRSLFYDAVSQSLGEKIDGDAELMSRVTDLAEAKREYDKLKSALEEAREKGYGIVLAGEREVRIEKPRLEKRGRGYCVRIDAETDSLHVVKIGVKAGVTPVSGSKKQCEEFMRFID